MDDRGQPGKPARNQALHQSGSFLLRIWEEGREIDGEAPKMRVFMRNLKTGEEHYLGDLDQLGEEVLRQFQQTGEVADESPSKSHPPDKK